MGKPSRAQQASEYEKFVQGVISVLMQEYAPTVYGSRLYKGNTGYEHQIDVSYEFTMKGFKLLVLVECKHYNARVSVGDILTFAQRIQDIGAHKGLLLSTVGFQSGAKKFAEARGIGLALLTPDLSEPEKEDNSSPPRRPDAGSSGGPAYRIVIVVPIRGPERGKGGGFGGSGGGGFSGKI